MHRPVRAIRIDLPTGTCAGVPDRRVYVFGFRARIHYARKQSSGSADGSVINGQGER